MNDEYGANLDQKRLDEREERRENRDPDPLPQHALDPIKGRVLDPGTALAVRGIVPRMTSYVGPALLIDSEKFDAVFAALSDAATALGWTVAEDPDYPPPRVRVDENGNPVEDRANGRALVPPAEDDFEPALRRLVIDVDGSRLAQVAPDGWVLLQQARATAKEPVELAGVGLDHVVTIHPRPHWDSNPNPHWDSNPATNPVASYGQMGTGGRQPVAFAGPAPVRRSSMDGGKRRPVVAILDTGCGEHPWLDFVQRHVSIDGKAIGYVGKADDPERFGDQIGPLDGGIDPLSGHGTFIAGLVHQRCPDADIIAWRVVDSDGPIVESLLMDTLRQVVELVEREASGRPGGLRIDVLNLSMGYYHETPGEDYEDGTLRRLLRRLARCGVAVVCSAGNDATARKLYPAAFARRDNDPDDPGSFVPLTSVGADNPNGTVALFSNTGKWVSCYAPGAGLLSTMPPFQGGLMPLARTRAAGLRRESLDPDDYRSLDFDTDKLSGGFALWSGTSFAAPIIAGDIAARLCGELPDGGDTPSQAVARARAAVEAVVEEAQSWKRAHSDGTTPQGPRGE